MNSIEITFDNGGRTIMLLDPADFINVSMDKSRPSNTRVRLVYLEPLTRNVKSLDMFFMGPEVPKGHVGPIVTSVSWDTIETAGSPEDTYAMLRSKALEARGPKVTQGTPGTRVDRDAHMDSGDVVHGF